MRARIAILTLGAGLLLAAPAFAQDDGEDTPSDDGVIELEQPSAADEGGAEPSEAGDGDEAESEADEDSVEGDDAADEEAPTDEAGETPPNPYPDPPEPTEAEKLAAQAEEAFVAGEYQRAIDLLQQAYDSDQNPNMLYNIARVHEETGDLESALDFYRRFVVAPNVDLDYRREALQSSETIEQTLAARAAAEEVAAAEAQESDQLPEQAVMLRPAPFPTTSSMRPLGFTLAAIGGATVLAGGIVGVAALGKEQDFRDAQSLAERRSMGASARDLATTADALYISGAVLIVTGFVTAFASPRRERPQQLGVNIRHDGVGAEWTVRF